MGTFTRIAALAMGVVLVAPATRTAAQSGDHILPRWKPGDVVEYRMIRTRTDRKGVMPPDVATTPVTLTVVSASELGFVVEWKQGTTTGSSYSEKNVATREMLKLAERAPLMLEVSPIGQVVGLANWEALRAEAYVAFDNVMTEAQKLGTTPGLVERAGPALKARFSTKEIVTATLALDARSLLLAMAQPSIASGTTVDGRLWNPLGGEHFPSTVGWTARPSPDVPSRTAVRWTHTVAPEIFSTRIRELVTKMMTTVGRPVPELTSITGSASGEGSAEIDLESGWPEFIEDSSTVVMDGKTTKDTKRFERIRPATADGTRVPAPPKH